MADSSKIEELEQRIEELEMEEIEVKPDDIEREGFNEGIGQENVFTRPIIAGGRLRGGEAQLGTGNSTMRFNETNGLWIGHEEFGSAPFRVDMDGNLVANSAIITGTITADSGSDVDWSYINNVAIDNADIEDGAITNAKIDNATIEYGKIASLDADDITTGTVSANYVAIGGDTSYESGYDPSTKLEESDVGDLADYDLAEDAMEDESIIVGGYIDTSYLTADNITTGTLDASEVEVTNLEAENIETGTLSGIDVVSTSGGWDRIELDSGDYLNFYADDTLRARLRGTTRGDGGLFVEYNSDVYLENDQSFNIESSGGGNFGGIGITGQDEFWLILGTDNTFYMKDNQDTNLFTVGSDGMGYFDGGIGLPEIDIGATNDYDIIPDTHETGQLGYHDRAWDRVYAKSIFSDDGTVGSYQTHEDVELIKGVGEKKQKGRRNSWDLSGLPSEVSDEGMVNTSQLSGLLIGTLKELIDKVETLEKEVETLK